ncbi:oligopeptide/dipeptide ABC transporter ATP-binding protein [Primorskyibacter sedentarius]|uniref:Oligopeptide/dipeptide ABC transporter ATP-binding protein n=1 Tax=Primorskyibacter sedentarius TaxID=745311 RepID=A0A4R3IW65_9RHOB|nr:ABC transporter ATP-binding protein [Primorskyibacter sedentarius]TCS55261.1 oligopeptide/dipeptide ABC transporter ATP-binding protein [Primorskyibacter sedentarius]
MTKLLDIKNLRVEIPIQGGAVHAVRGVDLSIDRGETLCIVGESGSGKSMSSLAVMNLLPKGAHRSADRMSFLGTDLLRLSHRGMARIRGDRIGMIFQEPMTSLNPAYTIGNQLQEVYRRHRRAGRAAARDRAIELLELVGIPNAPLRLRQYPHQLSGGLRQRVMIAMSLMCEPDILIADEPTSALDVTVQVQILHLLKDLQTKLGIAVILITHDLGVVARTADRVAVVYAGQILETGTARQVFGTPRHPYTARLLDSMPIPGMMRLRRKLQAIPGTVPSLTNDFQGCAFAARCDRARPECRTTEVPLVREDGHGFACLHPETEARFAQKAGV